MLKKTKNLNQRKAIYSTINMAYISKIYTAATEINENAL